MSGWQLKEEFLQAADTLTPDDGMDMFADEDDAPSRGQPAQSASATAGVQQAQPSGTAASVAPDLEPPASTRPAPVLPQVCMPWTF